MYLQGISHKFLLCYHKTQVNKSCNYNTEPRNQENKEHKRDRCDAAGYTALYPLRLCEKKLTEHSLWRKKNALQLRWELLVKILTVIWIGKS